MDSKRDCYTSYTYCLTEYSAEAIDLYQNHIKKTEKKSKNGFNKSQTLNRIIKEWAEYRANTLDAIRREK